MTPKKRSLCELDWNDGNPVARPVIDGRERETLHLLTCSTRAEARERADQIGAVAKRFRKANIIRTPEALELLRRLAGCPVAYVSTVLTAAEKMAGGEVRELRKSDTPTFRKVGEMWTNGELRELYPDRVKDVDQEQNASRLQKLYAIDVGGLKAGDVPIDCFGLDHAEVMMRNLPEDVKRSGTRKQYAMLINRVMKFAVYPLRLIKVNPMPGDFIRVVKDSDIEYTYVRPAEDELLMGQTALPLCWRIFFGFVAREGTRAGEAWQFQVKDFDFEDGSIDLPQNKTDNPRNWTGDPAVMRALRQWVAIRGAQPTDFMFVDEGGAPVVEDDRLAQKLREQLWAAGARRFAIHNDVFHKTTKKQIRGKLREHDLRATFVTLALRNGKTRDWIRARTGQTDQTIERYTRKIQDAEDRNLGELLPLDEAIPEMRQYRPTRDQWQPNADEPWAISPAFRPEDGGSTRNRTEDQRIKNPLL
jgi:integrase